MDRRTFIGTLAVGFLAAPLAAEAQQAEKVYRIGVLSSRQTPTYMTPFVDALRERGWIEGRNFTLEYRFTGATPEGHPRARANLSPRRST